MSRPNTGSIRQVGKDRWELSVSVGKDPVTGRYRRRTRAFTGRERQALAELKRWRADLLGTIDPDASEITVAAAIDRHLAALVIEGRSPSTLLEYRRLADRQIIPAIGHYPLADLTVDQLDRLYLTLNARGLGASSVRHVNAVISGTLTRAGKKGWLGARPVNVATYATKPAKPHSRPVAPATATVRQLIAAAATDESPERSLFLAVTAATGLRRGEVCGLRWADLDSTSIAVIRTVVVAGNGHGGGLQASTNHASKSAKSRLVVVRHLKVDRPRRIALGVETMTALRIHRARMEDRADIFAMPLVADAYIFSDDPDQARPWYPPIVSEFVGRLKRKHGIDAPRLLHGLRKHAATEMMAAGVDVAVGSERLGQVASMYSDTYAAARPARDQDAAALLDRLIWGD